MSDKEFQQRLWDTFKLEAREHVDVMTSIFMEMESGGAKLSQDLLERVYREAHSLKGAARAVNSAGIEAVCQQLESLFAGLKAGRVTFQSSMLDTLHDAVNVIAKGIDLALGEKQNIPPALLPAIRSLELGDISAVQTIGTVPELPPAQDHADQPAGLLEPAAEPTLRVVREVETVRASTAELDVVLRQAEEIFSMCLVQQEMPKKIRRLRDRLGNGSATALKRSSRQMTASGGDGADQLREAINDHFADLSAIAADLDAMYRSTREASWQLRRNVDQLLDGAKRLQMMPLSFVLNTLPKLVRDLSKDFGKKVQLEMHGGTIEVDRRILELLRDPLIHLVRNCIDHGLEMPADRLKAGKSETGTIRISATVGEGGRVLLDVEDDGRGVNLRLVRKKALRMKILSEEEAADISDDDLLNLIFHSGMSTSAMVTDISGHGLGLAIVREKVEQLHGSVRCFTTEGKGCRFHFVLPTSLATFRAVEVVAGKQSFLVPARYVTRVVRIPLTDVKSAAGRRSITVHDKSIPFASLARILEIRPDDAVEDVSQLTAVILSTDDVEVALEIEAVLGEQEVVMKPLGRQLRRVRNVSGAALLGSGNPVVVLNAPELIKNASAYSEGHQNIAQDEEQTDRRSVLVVEDSITSRMLLRDILMGAGYKVETAVDGVDGFTKLRQGSFEVVVSDVDMPRMSGFELTAKIRNDRQLADTPVILVTSLASREDRERGAEAGANAYIVKSNFDQSNLLEVIRRFV